MRFSVIDKQNTGNHGKFLPGCNFFFNKRGQSSLSWLLSLVIIITFVAGLVNINVSKVFKFEWRVSGRILKIKNVILYV